MKKVAFSTAILGDYELTCKKAIEQTIESDFICFTDNENMISNGWEIDTTPYHITHKSSVDTGRYLNSIDKPGYHLAHWKNTTTFNIAKYYKTQWNLIPRLKDYDVVIWLDGTIEITSPDVAEYMLEICSKYLIACWHHELRGGFLFHEAFSSEVPKYHDRNFMGQRQPYQNIVKQYLDYLEDGYDESFFKEKFTRKEGRGREDHFGVWLTAVVAFNNKNEQVDDFMKKWYLEILKHTTQDQVSFPKVVQDTGLVPYTFPDEKFKGDLPHTKTEAFIKHDHAI